MSGPGEEVTGDNNAIGNGDDEDDTVGNRRRRKKKRSHRGFSGKFRGAKQAFLRFFPGNTIDRRRSVRTRNEVAPGNARCVFCIRRPETLESAAESDASDPNNPAFTHEMLRTLLERNVFYSKECNPHLDVDKPNPDRQGDSYLKHR